MDTGGDWAAHRLPAAECGAHVEYDCTEHRPFRAGAERRRHHRRCACGRRARNDPAPARRLRHRYWRKRRCAVGWATATGRPRACALSQPVPDRARRAQFQPGWRGRGSIDSRDPGRARAGRYCDRHCAPPERVGRSRPPDGDAAGPRHAARTKGRICEEAPPFTGIRAGDIARATRRSQSCERSRRIDEMTTPSPDLRRLTLAIVAASLLLVVGLGGWAATTEFSGAVIASGQLVVDSNVKKVQHPTGGVVGALHVRDGTRVNAANIVVQLDDTQTRANLAIVVKALNELAARQAREEAERDGTDTVTFPAELLARKDDNDVVKAVTGELRQFQTPRAAREGQKAQLRERTIQLRQEIGGYDSQIASKENQIDWITKELVGVTELWEKNLIPYTRLTSLERDKERLVGERGQLIAAIAQAKGKIVETELQILQVDQDMRTEIGRDLAEIRAKTAELVERKVAAEDALRRVDIRAPIDGVVHQLTVHTVGGVISAGEPIMLVVPQADSLEVEAKVAPQEIDQLRVGQPAVLRFVAFSQRTTPEIDGTVSRISADVSEDSKSGYRYYTIRVSVSDRELTRLGNVKLVPGMPVEVLMQTGPRSVISFLVKPFQDQLARAFREK